MNKTVKIKFCGMKRLEDIRYAINLGIDYLGFILDFSQTPRSLTINQFRSKVKTLLQERLRKKFKLVAVTININEGRLETLIKAKLIDVVQFHGSESPEYCQKFKGKVEVWKTFKPKGDKNKFLQKIKSYKSSVDRFLIDASSSKDKVKGIYHQFNSYALFQKLQKEGYLLVLAGGLNPKNIEISLKKLKPKIIDLSSGIEDSPGRKSKIKMKNFVKVVKNYSLKTPPRWPGSEPRDHLGSGRMDFPEVKELANGLLESGHFGKFGGRYVPEMLIPVLEELEAVYKKAKQDPSFTKKLNALYQNYAGRPTPLYFAKNFTKKLGGAKIYLKNEGLLHTGAHKMNNCLGQALLAQRMGKKRLIAETGAGQHGLATATVAAKFGFHCTIYMGEVDIKRQRPNVFWMERLGAEVVPVSFGTKTLKDAVNAALKDWITNVKDTYYLLGSTVGPHPYPTIVRDFQAIIGKEAKKQILQQEGRLPDYLIACVGGGSNALGLFYPFLKDKEVKMIGVEAGGKGVKKLGQHAVRFQGGRVGVVEGYKSFFLQDKDGNILPTHSISAGLDYPGIGPEMAYLREKKRIKFSFVTDNEALRAFKTLAKTEGIIAALESCHAIAEAIRLAPKLKKDKIILVNLSGRGDKDIFILAKALADQSWEAFLKSQQ